MNGKDIDVLGDSGGIVVDALDTPRFMGILEWLGSSLGAIGTLFQHPEFWSAIVGALVGATVAGWIAYRVQMIALGEGRKQRDEDRLLAQQTLGRALFTKMLTVHTNFHGVQEHINESYDGNEIEGAEPWQYVKPIANPPDKIQFTTEEKGMLLAIKSGHTFNAVVELEGNHNSVVDLMRLYFDEWGKLTERLTVIKAEGTLLEGALNEAQTLALRPRMANVNSIVEGIHRLAEKYTAMSHAVLNSLQETLRDKLQLELSIQVEPQVQQAQPPDEPAAQQPAPPPAAAPAGGA